MSNQPTLQTVERALTFMEYIAQAESPPTVQQVSSALNLNITTCYHLMRTLLARGYLERRTNATLVLGSKIGLLFKAYHKTFNIELGLGAVIDRLAETTSETCFLSVLQDNSVVLKVLVEGSQTLRVGGLYVGLTGNEHRRASGKVVLAFADEAKRKAILANALADIPSRKRKELIDDLKEELNVTRSRGWSLDQAQTEHGIMGIGAPVFDSHGNVYGALGVVAPTFRMERSQDEYVRAVQSYAQEATSLLSDMSIQ